MPDKPAPSLIALESSNPFTAGDDIDTVSEDRLRLHLALESAGLGSWDLDLTTNMYVEISAIWKALFGLPPEAGASGFRREDFFALLHPDDRERIRSLTERAVQERADYEAEYRCVWPDGSVHWMSAHGRLICDGTGRPVRMIGVTQDVTERKTREAEREQALADALDRADRDSLTGLLNHAAFHRRLGEERERAQRGGACLAVVMIDLDNFKFFNDAYGHAAGDGLLRQVAVRLRACSRPYDTVARFGGDEFALLLPGVSEGALADVEARLRTGLDGLSFRPDASPWEIPLTASLGIALYPRDSLRRSELVEMADERLLLAKTGGVGDTGSGHIRRSLTNGLAGFSMLDALVTAVDNKDRYTRAHSEDVMIHSLSIAGAMGLDEKAQERIALAALLHDVGKIGVPDAILRKPGQLTTEEFAVIQQHPQMGAIMVQAVPGLEDILDAVRHHHERWDGGGYPFGLKGEDTPLMARLMAVADAYSAMTTDRPYRKGLSDEEALSILREGAGSQWDPSCLDAFLRSRLEA